MRLSSLLLIVGFAPIAAFSGCAEARGPRSAGDKSAEVYRSTVKSALASAPARVSTRRVDRIDRRFIDQHDNPTKPDADATKSPVSHNTEAYNHIEDNPFLSVMHNPLSTFSIDVDTASYSNIRRYLAEGTPPPKDAVRIEEMINYFDYDAPVPTGADPIAIHLEAATCPWNAEHDLLRVALKAKEISEEDRPNLNLVFLVDVSGSMNDANKLPLVKRSLAMLVQKLRPEDRVALVVYASGTGVVLPSTSGDYKDNILRALDRLRSGGSTAGSAGIVLAYDIAAVNFIQGGANRVILCTDGDFNVGVTSAGDLVRLIQDRAKTGVFLSVLGFGMGNLKDSTMEQLADKGNGSYAYIDSQDEAKKVLVDQMAGTLVAVAKDVKIQIEFNPAKIAAYRLIGYENRMLRSEDFNDDRKDAGEMGAGHTVTALYELVPKGSASAAGAVDPLKYQLPTKAVAMTDEILTLKLRYKEPMGDESRLLKKPLPESTIAFEDASADFRFAAAVASFGMLLRESPHRGDATISSVQKLARGGIGPDLSGRRRDFLQMLAQAERLPVRNAGADDEVAGRATP